MARLGKMSAAKMAGKVGHYLEGMVFEGVTLL
jgi:hypothetical protein